MHMLVTGVQFCRALYITQLPQPRLVWIVKPLWRQTSLQLLKWSCLNKLKTIVKGFHHPVLGPIKFLGLIGPNPAEDYKEILFSIVRYVLKMWFPVLLLQVLRIVTSMSKRITKGRKASFLGREVKGGSTCDCLQRQQRAHLLIFLSPVGDSAVMAENG